jgi:tetratricopeptide (TPR) repeat protein
MIPHQLVDAIRNGKVVLFLGAGASHGATDSQNATIPLGNALADKLANKFLDNSYVGQPLSLVSEVAVSEAGLLKTQSFVKDIFKGFQPKVHHLLIPGFKWKSIFTTNYDYILEEAYKQSSLILQELEPVYRNTLTDEIFKNEKSLPYYKLHGCLDCINDEKLPLILTPEQYSAHRIGRENLFRQLETLAFDHVFLFVGYSFADADIRQAINLASSEDDNRPRWYMVGPNIREAEKSLYERRRITSIVMSFSDFLNELNTAIPKEIRSHYFGFTNTSDHPFFRLFTTQITEYTDTFKNFIENDIDFIHKAMSSEPLDAHSFYKGYFHNWDPIIKNLDAKRSIEDQIVSEIYIDDANSTSSYPEFYVLLSHAGAGKSVLIKRLAFNGGNVYDKMCFFLKPGSVLKYEPLYELHKHINTRFYIHLDSLSEHSENILDIITKARKDNLPVTIITTERRNIWNVEYEELKQFVDGTFVVGNLNRREIVDILGLLERHNSLGHLAKISFEERVKNLETISNRQLLVALHEATSGKPFQDIIKDEYHSILDLNAKSLYLTVCILHRLGCFTRAGLISRVHGIRFEEFQKKLFAPLESIVFAKENNQVRDYVFETRHQQIAELVFEAILINEQDRYDEYHRIISNLNVDFESDRVAFIAMTKAKNLLELFSDPLKVYRLYEIANKTNPGDFRLLQQQAIYELKRPNPNRPLAEKHLKNAMLLAPNNPILNHTLAELILDKAVSSSVKLVKQKYLQECEQICLKLISQDRSNIHPYHTILKARIHKLDYYTKHEGDFILENLIKDVEKHLVVCKQTFPHEHLILNEESRFNSIINDQPKALEALSKAYELNKSSPFISIRLSDFHVRSQDIDGAISIVEQTLALNPNDKDVNFQHAMLMLKLPVPDYVDVKYSLKKSFTAKDTRYEAQFWYARTCFILKDWDNSKDTFQHLAKAKMNFEDKIRPKAVIKTGKYETAFTGKIIKLEYSYGVIRRDDFGDTIYFNRQGEVDKMCSFRLYDNVLFKIAFNYKGALAIDIHHST